MSSWKKAKGAYGTGKPEDVLHLKISGTKKADMRKTLTYAPGSKLAKQVLGDLGPPERYYGYSLLLGQSGWHTLFAVQPNDISVMAMF